MVGHQRAPALPVSGPRISGQTSTLVSLGHNGRDGKLRHPAYTQDHHHHHHRRDRHLTVNTTRKAAPGRTWAELRGQGRGREGISASIWSGAEGEVSD